MKKKPCPQNTFAPNKTIVGETNVKCFLDNRLVTRPNAL